MSRLSITRPATETRTPVAVSGGRSPGLGAHLRERVGARVGDGVGVDALLAQPVELGPAYPHLLGEVLGRQRLRHDVARPAGSAPGPRPRAPHRRCRGPRVGGALRGCIREIDGRVRKPSALPAADPDARQVGGVLEADEARLPRGQVLRVRRGRATRAASSCSPAAAPAARAGATGPAPTSAPRSNASRNIAKLSETGPMPKVARLVGQARDHELDQPVVGGRGRVASGRGRARCGPRARS